MTARLPFQIFGAAAFAVGSASAGETTTVLAEPPAPVEDPFADRLLGDMGGIRTSLAEYGLSLDLDGWYTLQGVADGGTGRGDDVGNLFNGRLGIKLDTDKAGLWPGGFFSFGLQGRGGDSVLGNAGATSPVNNAALFPLVPGRVGDDAWAITELTYTQFLSEKFGITGGLIDTTGGDANPIAGSLNSFSHFMNTGFLYSSVTGATVPTATLGGGLIFIPNPNVVGSFVVVGSNETAGTNPFDNYEGTTFSTEWTFKYDLAEKPGGVTVGGDLQHRPGALPHHRGPARAARGRPRWRHGDQRRRRLVGVQQRLPVRERRRDRRLGLLRPPRLL